jgi:ureidoglycolate lyase
MRRIQVEALTVESYLPFGCFGSVIEPAGERIGGSPIEFFRDQLPQGLGSAAAVSYSTCRVAPRPLIIDVLEHHSRTSEMMVCIDNDMIVQVGPATREADGVPLDQIRAFLTPRGTMITLRPGVWHHAPFTPNQRPLHVLVALPERTYANDCIVVELPENQRIEIQNRAERLKTLGPS